MLTEGKPKATAIRGSLREACADLAASPARGGKKGSKKAGVRGRLGGGERRNEKKKKRGKEATGDGTRGDECVRKLMWMCLKG